MYALSKHPNIQQKLYEEVKNGFADINKFTMAELNNLPYFDLVLKESLRMYPPVPVLGRRLLIPAEFSMFSKSKMHLRYYFKTKLFRWHYSSSWY